VTILVVGRLREVKRSLKRGGWTQARPRTFGNELRYLFAAGRQVIQEGVRRFERLVNRLIPGRLPKFHPKVPSVQHMPVSPQTFQGKPEVAAFERSNHPLGGRDHLRIFSCGRDELAIAASRDLGIALDVHSPQTGFLNHRVEPDVTRERNEVLQTLLAKGRGRILSRLVRPYGAGSVYDEQVPDDTCFIVAQDP
jgi:hypothetical protein